MKTFVKIMQTIQLKYWEMITKGENVERRRSVRVG